MTDIIYIIVAKPVDCTHTSYYKLYTLHNCIPVMHLFGGDFIITPSLYVYVSTKGHC